MTDRPALLAEIHALLESGSADELRAFRVIARRVMSGGREQYGPLILSNDSRNFRKERAQEMADWCWYAAIDEVLADDFENADTGVHQRFDTSDVEVA